MAFWSTSIENGKALFQITTLPESTTSLRSSNTCKGRHCMSARLANQQTHPLVSCKFAVEKVSAATQDAFPTLTAFLHLRTTESAGQYFPNFVFGWIYHASTITLPAEWDFISNVMETTFVMLLL
jgi:hypothetical protein